MLENSVKLFANVSRLEAVANFVAVNFPLLLNALRTEKVNLKQNLPLLQADVSGCSGFLKIGFSDLYKTQKKRL